MSAEYASRCRNTKKIQIREQKKNTGIQAGIQRKVFLKYSVCIPRVFRGYFFKEKNKTKPRIFFCRFGDFPARRGRARRATSCACAASNDAQKTRTQLRARRGWVARCITRTGAGGQGEKQTSTRQTGGRGNKRDDDDERDHRRDVQERANSGRD